MTRHDPEYVLVEQLLANAASDATAAEADGRLLSLGAMLGDEAAAVWLRQLVADGADANASALEPLGELAGARLSGLADVATLPQPWLPDDDGDLRDRVEAVAEWAGGFLAGLGEGAALRGSGARERLESEPLSELVSDLTEITRATVTAEELDEAPERAEQAYAEVVEYLRVVAQLAYEELAPVRALATRGDPNVH